MGKPSLTNPAPINTPARTTGHVLLRHLEHGQGPVIRIAWPNRSSQRAALYNQLTTCHGMKTLLVDIAGNFFGDSDPAGRPYLLNLDQMSGFMRVVSGDVVPAEQKFLKTIGSHHQLRSSTPIRLFARQVDASLLDGLAHAIPNYRKARVISGEYVMEDDSVWVTNLTADGTRHAGRIHLARTAACQRTR